MSSETAEKIIDAENRILADWGPEELPNNILALNERYLKCLQKELQRMKAEKNNYERNTFIFMKIQLSDHFTYGRAVSFYVSFHYHDDLHFDL